MNYIFQIVFFFLLYDPTVDSSKYYILIINVLLTNFMSIVTIIQNGDSFRYFNNNQHRERENKREEELHLRWVEIVEHRRQTKENKKRERKKGVESREEERK